MITVSAPGKIHLLGEHFVVYGAPALLATVNLRCTVQLTPRIDKTILIFSKNLNKTARLTIKQLMVKRAQAESDWKQFIRTNDVTFLNNIASAPLNHAAIAIAETFKYYGKKTSSGFNINIESNIPINAGLGSSSVISVAIAATIALFLKQKFDKKVINSIAYETEKRRHGNPSGADNATVTYGGIIKFIRKPKTIIPLSITIPNKLTDNFILIDTGKPNKSTGEMVAMVKTLREKNPKLFNGCLKNQSRLVNNLLPVLKNGDSSEFIRIIKQGEKNLENIGVVSKSSQKIIREIEKIGGAAKMCGAGGITGPIGIILAYHQDKSIIENIAKSYRLPYFNTELGIDGLRKEI